MMYYTAYQYSLFSCAGEEADGEAIGARLELQHAVLDQGQPGHHAGGCRPAGGCLQGVL